MPPAKQLIEIRRRVGELLDEAEELWLKELKPALEKKDVHFITYDELTGVRRQMVDKYFETEILPVLTPQGVDAGRPFPMISSRSINFVIELRSTDPSDEKSYFARLKNPNNVPRFLFVPKDLTGEETVDFASGDGDILMMEDLVANRMGMLFPGYKVKNYGMFRVTRNTDGEIEEDEADDLLAAVRDYVEQRRFGSIVRVELARGMPLALQDFLISHLDVHPSQVVRLKMPLAFNDFIESNLGNVQLVAWMLIIGGVFMLFCDRIFNKGSEDTPLTFRRAFIIGLIQCISMIPGVSRSMSTIVGGMSQKLTRKTAAEFSFFLAVPTMLGATCLEMYKMISHGSGSLLMQGNNLETLIIGSVVAFIVAILAIKFFINYVSKYGFAAFGWYRIIVGLIIIICTLCGVEMKMVD